MERDVDIWLRQLLEKLQAALSLPDAPVLDVEWLIGRCKDTLEYHGDVKDSSVEHLVNDLKQLAAEYPGLIPDSLLTISDRAEVAVDHPRQKFAFFIEDDVSPSDVEAMEAAISSLAGSRAWVIDGPRFVNETLEPDSPEDYPIQTVGGFLELFSARPPWGERLPRQMDKTQLSEVESVIDAMIGFSKATGREIAFELDGTQVGWVSNGEPDRGIRDGLLGPWRQHVQSRGA